MAAKSYRWLGIKEFFSPKGRLNRLTYFANGAGINILALTLSSIMGVLAANVGVDIQLVTTLTLVAVYIVLNYLWFCLSAKRLHDLGLTGWIGLALFIDMLWVGLSVMFGAFSIPPPTLFEAIQGITPFIGPALGLCLLFIPGKTGDNRYGPNPLDYLRPSKPHVFEG